MKNITSFLNYGGYFFVVLSVLGYFLNYQITTNWTLGVNENWSHLFLGFIMIFASKYSRDYLLLRWFSVFIGITGIYFAVYGFTNGVNYYGVADLENIDNIINLLIGTWALSAAWSKK